MDSHDKNVAMVHEVTWTAMIRMCDRYNNQTFASFWSDSTSELRGTSSHFDILGRLELSEVSGQGTVNYEYLSGNRVRVTDQVSLTESNETTTTYLAYGQPSYEQEVLIASPENVTTAINVNVYGQIESITQSGYKKDGVTLTSMTESRYYDDHNQLCLVKRIDVGNRAYLKNALGENVWVAEGVASPPSEGCLSEEPATAVSYILDNHGELRYVDYPDENSRDVQYKRNNFGNLLELTTSSISYNEEGELLFDSQNAIHHMYSYNNQNLLTSETLSLAGEVTLSLQYGYTDMLHRNWIEYPDETNIRYATNAFGWPTEVKSFDEDTVEDIFAKMVEHYSDGQVDSFVYGNDVSFKMTRHEQTNFPTQLSYLDDSSSVVAKLGYTYDYNQNISSITDFQDPTYSLSSLKYDGLDRLIQTEAKGDNNSDIVISQISYDGLNNITYYKSRNSVLDYTIDYSKNRLASVSGTKNYEGFDYDNRGNVTFNSHRLMNYNLANQLYSTDDGNRYFYDGFNRRVKQIDANGTSYSMYSQDGTLLYRESDVVSGSGKATNYVYLGKKLIAKITEEDVKQGSRRHYEPYGETVEDPSDDVGFTGHKFDTDLELSYMQARYYDPVIGRFYSNDPVGFKNVYNFNRYAYANNNPYKYIDPDGQFSTSAHNHLINLLGERRGWTATQTQAVRHGSKYADNFFRGKQSASQSHIHAMTSDVNTDIAATKELAEGYIQDKMDKAAALMSTNEYSAYHNIGQALHTVMDNMSPAHEGFQKWDSSQLPRHGDNYRVFGIGTATEENLEALKANSELINNIVDRMGNFLDGGSSGINN
ncbi:MAG: RHS repeat domain-containing protein [Aestuariibacter sp.]